MKSDLLLALNQLAGERNLPVLTVVVAIEEALVAAYRKDDDEESDIQVKINPENGEVKVSVVKTVVNDADLVDINTEIGLSEAKKTAPRISIGDVVVVNELDFTQGRIMAQNTKQMIMQRLREAERDIAFEKFEEKQGSMSLGSVYRSERDNVLIDIDRNIAVMPPAEQPPSERYRTGQQLQVLVVKVERTARGPEITVSRSSPVLLERLLEKEVPEVKTGVIEIKAISREAGFRSKVAVKSNSKDVDAVGACVGLRGIRIHNIVNEVMGEKIDVIEWSEDPAEFIKNALAPASVERVEILDELRAANVYVAPNNLSLAIGRDGQNVRLVGKLTGWKINVENVAETTPSTTEDTPEHEQAQQTDQTDMVEKQAASEEQKKVEETVNEAEKIEKLEQELLEYEEELEEAEKPSEDVDDKEDLQAEEEEQEVWDLDDEPTEASADGLTFAEDLKELKPSEKPNPRTKPSPKNKARPNKARGRK